MIFKLQINPFQEFFKELSKRFGKRAPSIHVSNGLSFWAGWAEEVKAFLLGQEPLVTRQSAKMAIQNFHYSNEKSRQNLGIRYRTLEQTLEWCCEQYLRNVKPNK